MKNVNLKLAVLAALSVSIHANAAGLEPIPAAGFASSAYTNCYNAGRTGADPKLNFGQYLGSVDTTTNSTCYVNVASITTTPVAGYTLVTSRTATIPTTTGGTGNIGTLREYVFRSGSTCIFASQVQMINADHDSTLAGTQLFEANDIARGGYSGSGTVNAGYALHGSTSASPTYRIGRTFTSVQHRAKTYNAAADRAVNGTNYLDLPTKNTVTAAITGENTPINSTTIASTTSGTQDAVVNSNWIDFTQDITFGDDDGGNAPLSGTTYIQAACNSTDNAATINANWVKSGALRLRQTAQENTTFKEISLSGYAPPGATVP